MFDRYYMDSNGYVSPNKHTPNDRPVVVISLEDREQIERFAAVLVREVRKTLALDMEDGRLVRDAMQAALREFANPKPPTCGARLSIDYGDVGANHTCEEPEGHDGAHSDDAMSWMTGGPR